MTTWPNGSKTKKPTVSSPYGPRKGGVSSFHAGTDFTGYLLVKAITTGRVTHVGPLTLAAGNAVAYDLAEKGPDGETITVVHMHLQRWAVKVGDIVKPGQQIGTMGASGNATGRCDHVEVRYWLRGAATTRDPEKWIAGRIKAEAVAALKPVKRTAKFPTRGRVRPNTATEAKAVMEKGQVGQFDKYTHAQRIDGNDVWFQGYKTNLWFWSGGFTSKSTRGMREVP